VTLLCLCPFTQAFRAVVSIHCVYSCFLWVVFSFMHLSCVAKLTVLFPPYVHISNVSYFSMGTQSKLCFPKHSHVFDYIQYKLIYVLFVKYN